mgnify:CR=1 FL=1
MLNQQFNPRPVDHKGSRELFPLYFPKKFASYNLKQTKYDRRDSLLVKERNDEGKAHHYYFGRVADFSSCLNTNNSDTPLRLIKGNL